MKKIFLLEDSENVVAVIQSMLTHLKVGAEVVVASTVSQGVEVLSQNAEEFSLAILDYELPDGYGTELVETIRRRAPQCKIVVASGCIPSDADAIRIIERQKPDRMLGKPFNLGKFAHTLRELEMCS